MARSNSVPPALSIGGPVWSFDLMAGVGLVLAASVTKHGNVIAAGPAAEWLADPSALEAAYFGEQ